MEKNNKDKNFLPKALLALSVIIFFSFGLFHLAKFETVDEHFWKYDRIPQYWKAVSGMDWKKTYINDKPGVTVALFSGIGLPFSPDPSKHEIVDPQRTQNGDYTVYDSAKTERINLALRLPILIINGIFLLFFFWIIRKVTQSEWIAAWSALFMALSPILIGISQIMNPDAFLWTFSSAAIFSFLASLRYKEKKYIVLAGIFTGLSLLSKYTANILFPLYFMLIFLNYFFNFKEIEEGQGTKRYFIRELLVLLSVFSIAIAIFSIFLPSVFIKPKHLYNGTVGFPGFKKVLPLMAAVSALLLLDLFSFKGKVTRRMGKIFHTYQQPLLRAASALSLASVLFILFDCWLGQKWINFDLLRDEAFFDGQMTWGGLLDGDSQPIRLMKEVLVETYPFVFSLVPVALLSIMALWIKAIWKGTLKFNLYIFFFSIMPVIFFSAVLMSKVLANIRYSIMLYPLYSFLAALAVYELRGGFDFLKISKKIFFPAASIVILFSGVAALWSSKPFYFNYTSGLLPKEFSITDAWGYGEYEAAQYLNSLPDARNLSVWSDRSGICQFILGRCIVDKKIDLGKTIPDYFVISKRGQTRYQFIWKYPELAKKEAAVYYSDDLKNRPAWSLYIGERPDNFLKIVKSEER